MTLFDAIEGDGLDSRADRLVSSVRSRVRSHRKVSESFASAAETVGKVEKDLHVFAITRGQFSMLDVVLHVLAEVGEANVSVWTWAIADYEVEAMCGLMARREILAGRLVVDSSSDKRSPEVVQAWRDRFGDDQVRICRNHAKIARVWNDDFRVLVRGSMNLNYNPRFEQLDLTEGGPEFDLVASIEDEMPVLPKRYTHSEVESASKLSAAYERSTLDMFRGVKVWAK